MAISMSLGDLAKSKAALVALASALSALGGAVAGYVVAKNQLEKAYAELSEREIAEAKVFYSKRYKKDSYATLDDVVEGLEPEEYKELDEAVAAMRRYRGEGSVGPVAYDDVPLKPTSAPNIADEIHLDEDDEDEEFDFELEMPNRTEDEPYIITHDEFMTNELDFMQDSLVYYEGDDILADKNDEVTDIDVIGAKNLRFGHGSHNNEIVFIRNHELSIELEVCHHDGSYAEVVHGYVDPDKELKHSDRRGKGKIRKFRGDDE